MDIPKLEQFFLPVLQSIGSRNISYIREVEEDIRKHFNLSDQQMSLRVPNKTKTIVYDKVTWAMTYLFKAGLIAKVGHGQRAITEKGRKLLSKHPSYLTWKELRQLSYSQNDISSIPSSDRFKTPQSSTKKVYSCFCDSISHTDGFKDMPPPEILEKISKVFEELKKNTLEELLNKIKTMHWQTFEEFILKVLSQMGYGKSEKSLRHTGGTGDEGIDGEIFQDPLGCDRIYLQVKRYKTTTVGRPEIQKFQGAMESKKSKKGIFVTTSQFATGVEDYLKTISSRIVLIDGKKLAELLYKHNIGVKRENIFEYKVIDEAFFDE